MPNLCQFVVGKITLDDRFCQLLILQFSFFVIFYQFLVFAILNSLGTTFLKQIECYHFGQFIYSDNFFTNFYSFGDAICFLLSLNFWSKIYKNSEVIPWNLLFLTDSLFLEFWWSADNHPFMSCPHEFWSEFGLLWNSGWNCVQDF